MKPDWKFSEIPYSRPDFDAAQASFDSLAEEAKNASTYEAVRDVILRANKLGAEVNFAVEIAYIRCYQNCTDAFYQTEMSEVMQRVSLMELDALNSVLVTSPFAEQVDAEFGSEYLNRLRSAIKVKTNGKELMAKEQMLLAQYQQLKAGLKIEFQGNTLSEAELGKYQESTDRETRKSARIALYKVLVAHKDEFESLLNDLISVRLEIARLNGYDSYLDYINEEKGRRGYGEKELAAFCNQVKRDLVPYIVTLFQAQAKRLGLEKLMPYDYSVIFPDGNPKPAGDAAYLLDAAKAMYHGLSKESGDFFDLMLSHDLIDVAASPNKIANMGFCTSLDTLFVPFVFGNCNGTPWDVTVLTHEVGHAFQAYMAMQKHHLTEYFFGVNDISEVPSKTMEQFAYPYAEAFFGGDADKFRFAHLQSTLEEIAAYCQIHEFETWLYTHQGASTRERALAYEEVVHRYDPTFDNSEFAEYVEQGVLLYRNMAVYMFPRYVISYALSAMCAMEFKKRMEENDPAAWQDYLALCAAGGSMSYPELLKLAHLSLAYEDGAVKRSTEYAKKLLTEYIEREKQ